MNAPNKLARFISQIITKTQTNISAYTVDILTRHHELFYELEGIFFGFSLFIYEDYIYECNYVVYFFFPKINPYILTQAYFTRNYLTCNYIISL